MISALFVGGCHPYDESRGCKTPSDSAAKRGKIAEYEKARVGTDSLYCESKDLTLNFVLVVWDVDLLSNEVVRVYRASDPGHPTIYRRGESAEAEPAVPGWTMAVDNLFV